MERWEPLGTWIGRKADGDRCRDLKGEFMVETTAWEGGR